MNKETKRALLSDLIFLARADKKVTESEYDFILRIAERMELSKADVNALFENPIPSKPQNSELQRLTHFYKLVLVMNVDRETHESEVIAIRNFGLKMGIRPGVVDQILMRMHDFEDKIIPSDELIKIFQTYYN
jgi:uncharacterized tellurite resistance protein B-like protein